MALTLPSDYWLEVLAFLNRRQIASMQTVSQFFNSLVEKSWLQSRPFLNILMITFGRHNVIKCCYRKKSYDFLLLELRFDDGQGKNVRIFLDSGMPHSIPIYLRFDRALLYYESFVKSSTDPFAASLQLHHDNLAVLSKLRTAFDGSFVLLRMPEYAFYINNQQHSNQQQKLALNHTATGTAARTFLLEHFLPIFTNCRHFVLPITRYSMIGYPIEAGTADCLLYHPNLLRCNVVTFSAETNLIPFKFVTIHAVAAWLHAGVGGAKRSFSLHYEMFGFDSAKELMADLISQLKCRFERDTEVHEYELVVEHLYLEDGFPFFSLQNKVTDETLIVEYKTKSENLMSTYNWKCIEIERKSY